MTMTLAQEEIVEHLRESGITATQATVSEDIKELGIVKIPLKDNISTSYLRPC